MRETKQIIEIRGRKFVLNKFDPFFGNYITLKLFSSQDVQKGFSFDSFMAKFANDSYEEYEKFTKKILHYCSEILQSGEVPIINSEGNIAIVDLEAPLMMELFTREMMFNIESFFEDDPEAKAQINQEIESI